MTLHEIIGNNTETNTELLVFKNIQTAIGLSSTDQENINEALIRKIAEDVHPGAWDLGPIVESKLLTIVKEYIGEEESCGQCDECENENWEDCENSAQNASHFNRLLIHFPEFTINNSNGCTHDIKDYYIAIIFSEDFSKLALSTLFGLRTTITDLEYFNGYMHSHANINTTYSYGNSTCLSFFNWRNLCLGSDTELTEICGSLALSNDGIDEAYMYELLVLLNLYVNWESLEGGPYRKIESLVYDSNLFSTSSNRLFNFYVNQLESYKTYEYKKIKQLVIQIYNQDKDLILPKMVQNGIINLNNSDFEYVFNLALLNYINYKVFDTSETSPKLTIIDFEDPLINDIINALDFKNYYSNLFTQKDGTPLVANQLLESRIVDQINYINEKINTYNSNIISFNNTWIPLKFITTPSLKKFLNVHETSKSLTFEEIKLKNALFRVFTYTFIKDFMDFKHTLNKLKWEEETKH